MQTLQIAFRTDYIVPYQFRWCLKLTAQALANPRISCYFEKYWLGLCLKTAVKLFVKI